MRLANYLLAEIAEAQTRSMDRLIRGWDEEIKRAQAALLDAQKRRLAAEAQNVAEAAWLAQIVQGLLSQASSSTHEISASIPGFAGLEGLVGGGTSVAELSAVLAQVTTVDDEYSASQRRALTALVSGAAPKPNDIADIFGALSVELASRGQGTDHQDAVHSLEKWQIAFHDHHAQLARLVKPVQADPQLQMWIGAQQLAIVHQSVKLLEAHRPERTLRLIAHPESLLDDPRKIHSPPPLDRTTSARMGSDNFHQMLDQLPWAATSRTPSRAPVSRVRS